MKGEAFTVIGFLQTGSLSNSVFLNNKTYVFEFKIRHPALIKRFMPMAMSDRLLDISENRGGQFSTIRSQCRVSCIREDRDIRMLIYLYPRSRMQDSQKGHHPLDDALSLNYIRITDLHHGQLRLPDRLSLKPHHLQGRELCWQSHPACIPVR